MNRRPVRWTEELDEYIFKKRSAGEPLRLIGTMINCSHDAVKHRFDKLCKWRGVEKVDRRKMKA